MTAAGSLAERDPGDGWDDRRWAGILERIEHRQAGLGLRFCGPPLWLEVTMSGPDSDLWSTADADGIPDRAWDWQSSAPCTDAMRLAEAGAGDERLLGAASRYTLENLVLNSVHEIGEWLRFDARRLFPAHGSHAVGDGLQGNGVVNVHFRFDEPSKGTPSGGVDGPAKQRQVSDRAGQLAAAWRFTYLPATSISYGPHGPAITDTAGDSTSQRTGPTSTWSAALDALDAPDADFVEAVKRDVHRAVILHEADRVCEAFHVDGSRPWRLDLGAVERDDARLATTDGRPLGVSVSYESAG